MVVSDTAANVKSCRATICAFWPWILNCPDPCHQLNLMMKDIMVGSKKFPKIGAFTEVSAFLALSFCYISLTSCHGKAMKIISGITTYFSHSNHGTHHLKEEMKKETDKRGIEIAGVTRFSTFSIHASSIARCFPAIKRCLESGSVKFDTAAVHFQSRVLFHPSSLVCRRNLFASILNLGQSHTNS
jgi:hypothetical protein